MSKEAKKYAFRGMVQVRVNDVRVIAENGEEAMEKARRAIESALTFYGLIDTQVDNMDEDIYLEQVGQE